MFRFTTKIAAPTLRQARYTGRLSMRHMHATTAIRSPAAAAPKVAPIERGKTSPGSAFVTKDRRELDDAKVDLEVPGTEGRTSPGSAGVGKEEFEAGGKKGKSGMGSA